MKSEKLSGTVRRYKGNGRRLGYPTANIVSGTKLEDGVYFGLASLDGFLKQPALIFIGVPTTMGDTERRVEAYLFDIPDRDYYDQELKLEVLKFHRANQKFSTVDELIQAIKEDESAARQFFAEFSSGSDRT